MTSSDDMLYCYLLDIICHLQPFSHRCQLSFNSCSTFIGQVSLPCIRQLLTQVAYTLPFSFNENPLPVRMGRYSRNFFQADLTLAVTAESHPPSASNIISQRTGINQSLSTFSSDIQLPISRCKSVLSPSVIGLSSLHHLQMLTCIMQTSFHSTTSSINLSIHLQP